MFTQRDEAVAAAAQQQRTVTLLQQEQKNLKLQLSRVTQEKLKIERDSVRGCYRSFFVV